MKWHRIPGNRAANINGLMDIIQHVMENDMPALVPEWNMYSSMAMGSHKVDYYGCSNCGYQAITINSSSCIFQVQVCILLWP